MVKCGVKRCRCEHALTLRSTPLCWKHWSEYCDRTQKKDEVSGDGRNDDCCEGFDGE